MSTKKWLCKSCADGCYLAGTDGQISFCLSYKPQTNADRIRAMSDEELAEFLEDETWMCESYDFCHECPRVEMSGDCVSVLGWLRQPVKDGDNE